MEGLMYRGSDYEIDYQKPVKVYRNLNNKKLSIIQNNKVVAYCESIFLENISFHVQKKGREKVLKEKRKNVHAYVKGYISKETIFGIKLDNRVYYNPYRYKSFVTLHDEAKINKCKYIFMKSTGEMFANIA